MNKWVKRGITAAGGAVAAGVSIFTNLPDHIPAGAHTTITKMSDELLGILGPYQPSSDDLITLGSFIGGAIFTALTSNLVINKFFSKKSAKQSTH